MQIGNRNRSDSARFLPPICCHIASANSLPAEYKLNVNTVDANLLQFVLKFAGKIAGIQSNFVECVYQVLLYLFI